MRIMTVHTMDPELQDTEAIICPCIYRKENVEAVRVREKLKGFIFLSSTEK
jgi:ferredoxin-thioredoxin reductase catalytic subunit